MSSKSPFRALIAVYLLAILAGTYEYFAGSHRDPDIYGDPRHSFPDAISKLYPGSSEAEYLLGRKIEAEAAGKFDLDELKNDSARAQQALDELTASLRAAATHYERAIDLGLKSDENLYYNYALILMKTQAPPEKIDRAIALWRQNFPFSSRSDLKGRWDEFEKHFRKHKSQTTVVDSSESDVQKAVNFVPQWQEVTGYTGSQACKECHPKEFQSYLQTAHSNSLADVEPDSEPPDATFDHAASGRRYRIRRREGKLVQEESLILADDTEFPLTTMPLKYRVGTGHFAKTYLCDGGGGFLFESPVTWYQPTQSWEMTPGFDKPNHKSFARHILENCLWCHSGQVQMSTTSHFRLRPVENAIGCERCHGPGEAHITHRRAPQPDDNPDPIVNPRKLERHLAEGICQQCHLQSEIHIGGRGVRAADYRPGQLLEQFSTVYRRRTQDDEMTVVGHVEQLGESACYQQSSKLSCVTCHDPHAMVPASQRTDHFRSVCMSCHEDRGCKLELSARQEKSGNDCIQCHMPRSSTEVPHLAFTHHRIGLHPQKNKPASSDDLLVSLSDLSRLSKADRERSLMLANTQLFLQRPEFRKTTEGEDIALQIEDWLRSQPARTDAETEYARAQFFMARGNVPMAVRSAERAIAAPDIRSEEKANLLSQFGEVEFRRDQIEKARQYFGELVRLRSQSHDWLDLGISEERSGRRTEAIVAFERARQLDPANQEIYQILERIRHAEGDFSAELSLKKSLLKLKIRKLVLP